MREKEMPVGVTILGRWYDEVRVLLFSWLVEQAPPKCFEERRGKRSRLPATWCHGCYPWPELLKRGNLQV